MRFPNPFAGLENPKRVWAWGMYDLANQSFTLLIITLLFSLYFKDAVVAGPAMVRLAAEAGLDPSAVVALSQQQEGAGEAFGEAELPMARAVIDRASRTGALAWSLVHGLSYVVVVLLSPLLGAAADVRAWRKRMLIGTGLVCAFLTCMLGILPPSWVIVLAAAYFVGNVFYQVGENFLASFLPEVSTPRTIGRVSALGWAMGYLGALVLLVLVAGIMLLFGLGETSSWRPLFVFAGVWFVLGMIPAMMLLPEPDHRRGEAGIVKRLTIGATAGEAFRRVKDTLTHARQYRQLVLFLCAFFVYGLGVQVVIGFASIIASGFGFAQTELVLFVLQITVTAGIAAVVTGKFQDRIGARATVMIYLCIWVASSAALLGMTLASNPPGWLMWVIGNGLGFGLGGIGTASRSLVARFTPKHRSAEFFGLWGLSYRAAAAVGVLSFGAVKAAMGDAGAMGLLMMFFVVGLGMMLLVNESAGVRAAKRAERDWANGGG